MREASSLRCRHHRRDADRQAQFHRRDVRFDMSRVAHSRMFRNVGRHSRMQFVKAPLERLINHVTLLAHIVGQSDIPTVWIKGTEDGETNDEA